MTRLLATALSALLIATPVLADITVSDAYVRSSTPASKSGAVFMVLSNGGDTEDRLIGASTDAADRAELHTHLQDGNGVMRMVEVKDGIAIPAGGTHALARGGDHVMLMGLSPPLVQGEEITMTLTFEAAGKVEITVPVDSERRPTHGAGHTN